MENKKIFVTSSSMPPIEEYIKTISTIWENKHLTNMGPLHNQFEKKLQEKLKVSNVSLFVNGHFGLYAAIKSLNLSGEVITTPFTFVSTTHAIVQNGLKPVFCDINLDDYTIDVNEIEKLITDKTSAIIAVHVYGNPCNVEKIEQIARKHNLKVIYDAAHAFGIEINNKGIGSFGDVSMFSFHATKVFNTIEGGAVTFNNNKLVNILNCIKNFGLKDKEDVMELGINAKMNEFQAAMGLCNLNYIDNEIKKKEQAYFRYISRLSNINGIKLCLPQKNIKMNYAYFPVLFDKNILGISRDDIIYELNKNYIFPRRYFYPLISDMEYYKKDYDSSLTPKAKYAADNILTLPLYADLTLEEVDKICDIILETIK